MIASVRAFRRGPLLGLGGKRTLANDRKIPKVPRYADQVKSLKCSDYESLKVASEVRKARGDIPLETDVLIIGGGVIGSSIAYWMMKLVEKGLNIVILEKDPTYHRCATTRSAGGIRQQFSLPENIQLSMFGAQFLSDYKHYLGDDAPDIHFNPEGYMFLANTDSGAQQMEENFKVQKQMGARVRLYSKEMLNQQFPFLNVEDVKLASYGLQNEGWFDAWSLLQGLKEWNLRHQISYVHGELVDFRFVEEILGEYSTRRRTNEAIIRLPNGFLLDMTFSEAVVCAGADSGHVGRILGCGEGEEILSVPAPVEPRKRGVYSFHAPDAPIVGFPFLIDPSNTYVRREGLGGHFICGKSPNKEDDNGEDIDLESVDESWFYEVIWPALAKRVPAFENIKLKHSWCGCYDYNYFDENAIIGKHPYFKNISFCTGFSGHGLQMAPGAGRAVCELILEGGYQTIDLTRFGFERILMGEPLKERHIV
ncbi:FAD-dependent oxidoreductase domain-containing protein 1 [Galendromus occidentalis]|uniref:FAD-dependent oxidoreductase domain-containing protein 1 n=1 Tax=Galendromus occidentalis TaxID=34638 RepID=A0AAJ6VYR8_9ACAR|nr:FAD-dependent oxidoreductase domain-containing protein 1 [Galendromus occidentalis]